ncbi:HesA/MoeB/ThiF family protein [Actinomadura syzygii]|uniref:ThiF family adenylyltransferase n=1 Tax=Actinomadura syzygii TaxID=1427538 RepID=A0A5D0TTH3_9ACTN|nr:ThiF family adenylyltransferase [Actinomadura syzygii]TYC08615.1 ThiF family adenylyltransferase [Actinomadura syzygii]
MKVALKDSVWERSGETLIVMCDPVVQIELVDPEEHVETLLSVLSAGPLTVPQLRRRLIDHGIEVSMSELRQVLADLDSLRLLTDPEGQSLGDPADDERFHSNLFFFDLFSTMGYSRAAMQERLLGAHVLQLGTGGVGSSVLQHLAGLGIGRITLLDFDLVEPRNFARQYLYRRADIGSPKVRRAEHWLQAFDPRVHVEAVEQRVTSPRDVTALLADVDVVSAAIDSPKEVDGWVNEACMEASVPFVRGGISGTRLRYYSVDPGKSPCLACAQRMDDEIIAGAQADAAAWRLSGRLPSVNRAIGPVAGLLGSMVAFEILRYLIRYEPPHAAGAYVTWDAADHLQQKHMSWTPDPSCRLCRDARERHARPLAVSQ